MIEVTQEEVYAFNVINGVVKGSQEELNRQVAARGALVKLLEDKYEAVLVDGIFKPREKPKAK